MTTNYSYFIAANFLKKWIHTSSWGLHLFGPHLKPARAFFLISGSPLWWQIELSLSPLDNRKNGQNKWGKVVQRRWFEYGFEFWVTEGWRMVPQCAMSRIRVDGLPSEWQADRTSAGMSSVPFRTPTKHKSHRVHRMGPQSWLKF